MELSKSELEDIREHLKDYLDHPEVKRMSSFIAHGHQSVLKHCFDVAECAYVLNKKLGMKADLDVLLPGALLHDFYLYDWHDRPLSLYIFKMHGYTHPEEARSNAVKYFDVNEKIQNVIKSHMWPLTLRSIPRCKEAVLICMADKICALKETFNR